MNRQPLNAVKSLDDNTDLAAHGTRAIISGLLSRDVLLQVSPLRDFHTLLLLLLLRLLFNRSCTRLPPFLLLLHFPPLRDAVKLRLRTARRSSSLPDFHEAFLESRNIVTKPVTPDSRPRFATIRTRMT